MVKLLVIASEVRSGSTFLAEILSYTLNKLFGSEFWDLTKEHFNTINDSSLAQDILSIYDNIWVNQLKFKSSKLMCSSISVLNRESKISEDLRNIFFGSDAYWIILRRRNKIRQAVSLAFARSSGVYHHYVNQGVSLDNNLSISTVDVYDALRAIELSDIYLELFSKTPTNSITLFYEDLIDNPEKYLLDVVRFIGIPYHSNSVELHEIKLIKTAQEKKNGVTEDFAS